MPSNEIVIGTICNTFCCFKRNRYNLNTERYAIQTNKRKKPVLP